MKVGNPHCFVRLASVKKGEQYIVRLCLKTMHRRSTKIAKIVN